MFKIIESTIHSSRGDRGAMELKIPITDEKNFIQYKDEENNLYWYDNVEKVLYDFNYNKSEKEVSSLTMVIYQFNIGDKITFKVYSKGGYNKEALLEKNVIIEEVADSVDINLTEEDTTFGEIPNKPIIYWYDVTLNDDTTVICYDEEGAKEFIQYPAKGDEE